MYLDLADINFKCGSGLEVTKPEVCCEVDPLKLGLSGSGCGGVIKYKTLTLKGETVMPKKSSEIWEVFLRFIKKGSLSIV